MQANPDKFQAIAVGERTFEKNLILKISDTKIICEEVVKILSVDIDYKLNFDQYISNLCRKAGQQLNVLKRLSPFLSRLNINLQYFTHLFYQILIIVRWFGIFVVRIILESWKKIQERALQFVYEDFDSSYEELLNKAKIPTFHVRRLRTMALETFKILNNMSPPVLSNLVRLRENTVYNFRYNNILQVPRVSTSKFGKKSFSDAAAVLWNSFPDEFRKVSSFNQFKALISNWNGGDFKCKLCR